MKVILTTLKQQQNHPYYIHIHVESLRYYFKSLFYKHINQTTSEEVNQGFCTFSLLYLPTKHIPVAATNSSWKLCTTTPS